MKKSIGEAERDAEREVNTTETFVIVKGAKLSVLSQMAITTILDYIKRFSKLTLPVETIDKVKITPPGTLLIIIGTPETNSLVKKLIEESCLEDSLKETGGEGFLAKTIPGPNKIKYLLIAGNTDAGVYRGAVYIRDFYISIGKNGISFEKVNVARAPKLNFRGVFCEPVYGIAPTFNLAYWKDYLDSMAEDSMNAISFFLAGLFRSKLHPETFSYTLDATMTRYLSPDKISLTTNDIQKLIRHAHDRKISFYLGSGVFTYSGAAELVTKYPEIRAKSERKSMCPSNPKSRELMAEYLLEMLETFPEADGLLLELPTNLCECKTCSKKVDKFGSLQRGASEINFVDEVSKKIWQKKPETNFIIFIWGDRYENDVACYEKIHSIKDSRIIWLYGHPPKQHPWDIPGRKGLYPLAQCSPNIIWFNRSCGDEPLSQIIEACHKVHQQGLLSCWTAFMPGLLANSELYGLSCYYAYNCMLPTDLFPHCLIRLCYREASWEPAITEKDFDDKLYRKYFSLKVPPQIAVKALKQCYEVSRLIGDKSKHSRSEEVMLIREMEELIDKELKPYLTKATEKDRAAVSLLTRTIEDIKRWRYLS